MILKKLIVNNYKQHEHKDIDLDGNIIGIIGPNGSGKSNLLGALQFAFSGEQPGSKRDDLLSWGADNGDVKIQFIHNDIEGIINRNLHDNKATFKYGDDSYHGIKKVADGIELHLGLDKELLRQTIFVRQAEIDSVLFTDPRIRELAFQKLCGIGEAAKTHKHLGDILTTMSELPEYDIQIAESKQRHTEIHARLTQLKLTQTNMTNERKKAPTQEEFQAQLSTFENAKITLTHYTELLNKIETYIVRIKETEKALTELPASDVDINALNKQIETTNKLLIEAEKYQQVAAQWEKAGKALMDLGDAPKKENAPISVEQLHALQTEAQTSTAKYNEIIGNFNFYTSLLTALKDKLTEGMECPICGGRITDATRLNKLQQQTKSEAEKHAWREAQNAADAAASNLAGFEQAQSAKLTQYKAQSSALVSQFAQAETAMLALPKVELNIDDLKETINSTTNTRNLASNAVNEKTRLNANLQTGKEQSSQLDNERKQYLENIAAIPVVMDKLKTDGANAALALIETNTENISNSIVKVRQLDQQFAELSGMINELDASIVTVEKTIGELEYKRSQQDAYNSARQTIENVRDWFHYNNGPHALSVRVLSEMTQDVNSFLGQFAAPFTVTHNIDTLGFNCIFHDGRAMPESGPPDAFALSGGEKILLATSFRFASYCMFAGKLGFLSLDEPTVYLDDANVARFCTFLEKIKATAQKMNLQVLISTHERSTIPFVDTLIDLA